MLSWVCPFPGMEQPMTKYDVIFEVGAADTPTREVNRWRGYRTRREAFRAVEDADRIIPFGWTHRIVAVDVESTGGDA